jgi:hypothetical protein
MYKYVDISAILKGHIKSIGKPYYYSLILISLTFFEVMVLYFNWEINESAVNQLVTGLVVFLGLIFSIPILIVDLLRKEHSNNLIEPTRDSLERDKKRHELIEETYYNIGFMIILSAITVACLILNNALGTPSWAIKALYIINFSLLFNIAYVFFMVLKRVHAIIRDELEFIKTKRIEAKRKLRQND